jgi:hypothetical protein
MSFQYTDFSGVPYQLDWPGTNRNRHIDRALHPTPISLKSPLFTTAHGEQRNYARVAFEANIFHPGRGGKLSMELRRSVHPRDYRFVRR